MGKIKRIHTPLSNKVISSLKAGDEVLLSGVIYTARDQAHSRIAGLIKEKEPLPVDLGGHIIYYCGPTPPGKRIIGSCGPTTSARMDLFTPQLLKIGVKGMIGKGRRSPEVARAIRSNKAVYFLAPGGAGAYLSGRVKKCQVAAFKSLGPEAIYELVVEDFPLIVGIDCKGRDVYGKIGARVK